MSRFDPLPTRVQRLQDTVDWLKTRIDAISDGAGLIRVIGDGSGQVGVPVIHTHQGSGEGGSTLAPALFRFPSVVELTIDTNGEVTRTQNFHTIDTENDDPTDNLDVILGGTLGDWLLILPANGTRTIVVRHQQGGFNSILTNDTNDISLTEITDMLLLVYLGTGWYVIGQGTLQVKGHDHTNVAGGNAISRKGLTFHYPDESLATGVFLPRPSYRILDKFIAPAGEGTQRFTVTAGTVGAGTNTVVLESSTDRSAWTIQATVALDAQVEDEINGIFTADWLWDPLTEYLRVRCTAVGGTAPKDVSATFDWD